MHPNNTCIFAFHGSITEASELLKFVNADMTQTPSFSFQNGEFKWCSQDILLNGLTGLATTVFLDTKKTSEST